MKALNLDNPTFKLLTVKRANHRLDKHNHKTHPDIDFSSQSIFMNYSLISFYARNSEPNTSILQIRKAVATQFIPFKLLPPSNFYQTSDLSSSPFSDERRQSVYWRRCSVVKGILSAMFHVARPGSLRLRIL